MKHRIYWIDALRGVAIIAVVLDHALYLFPQSDPGLMKEHMYFSIPWFIFLAGYTNALSESKNPDWNTKHALLYLGKRARLLLPYLTASVVCYIVLRYPNLRMGDLSRGILWFSTQPTYYFINLILQLSLVFPVLYLLFRRLTGVPVMLASLALITAVSLLLMKIPPIWPFSPAGRFFGGVYLLIFSLGIIAGLRGFPKQKAVYVLAAAVFGIYEYFVIKTSGSFVWLIPNLHLTAWSLSLLMVSYQAVRSLNIPPVRAVLGILGRQSLSVYLYHFLILTLGVNSGVSGTWGFVLLTTLSITFPAAAGLARMHMMGLFRTKKALS